MRNKNFPRWLAAGDVREMSLFTAPPSGAVLSQGKVVPAELTNRALVKVRQAYLYKHKHLLFPHGARQQGLGSFVP